MSEKPEGTIRKEEKVIGSATRKRGARRAREFLIDGRIVSSGQKSLDMSKERELFGHGGVWNQKIKRGDHQRPIVRSPKMNGKLRAHPGQGIELKGVYGNWGSRTDYATESEENWADKDKSEKKGE